MTHLNRRILILAASSAACLALTRSGAGAAAAVEAPSPIGEMWLGGEDAKVTVIEYASMSCPHCQAFHETTYQQLKTEYIDTKKIRFIFREFPHNDAGLAGFMIARCAPKEKYFGLVEAMFKTQGEWLKDPRAGLFRVAQQAGFTQADFDACLTNEEVAKGILSVRQAAEGFGVTGIPTFFINGELYSGEQTFEAFKSKIDPLLG